MTRLAAAVIAACLALCVPGPAARGGWMAVTTWYEETGITASGAFTGPGVAACSYDLPLGTRLRFIDSGEVVTCLDRGRLGNGSPTWVDIWAPDGWATVAPWGQWREIEVVQ